MNDQGLHERELQDRASIDQSVRLACMIVAGLEDVGRPTPCRAMALLAVALESPGPRKALQAEIVELLQVEQNWLEDEIEKRLLIGVRPMAPSPQRVPPTGDKGQEFER